MNAKDYIKIFEQSSELLVVIDTNFEIVAASDSFLKTTTTVRENIVGRNAFDVFPDNPDDKTANGERIMRGSFNRVLKNKTKDVLPVVKYDIPKPESAGGGYELKYWQATNSPILDDRNNVKYIVHRTEDVTENETLVALLDVEHKALKLVEDSEKRYNMMLMKSPFAFAILKGKTMVITLANDSVKEIWGKGQDLEGKPLLDVLPEIKDSEFPGLLDKVYTTGVPFCGEELPAPVFRNGKLQDVYFNFVYQPYLEADETISGVTIIAYEVTAAVIVKNALAAKNEAEHKALKQVEETNKRYYEMLMESPFAFSVMKGKDMVITLANSLIKEFWGKGYDVEGKTLLEVLPELKDQPFPGMIDKVYTTGIPVYANEILGKVTYNGQLKHKYFNVVFQPYYEADNTISGVIQIAYEVTEMVLARKKIEQSEAHFRQLADLMPAKISNSTPEGNVTYFNKHWLDYSGYSFEDLRDFGYHKIMHPDELEEFQQRFQNAAAAGTVLEMEMRFKNKEGDYRWHLNLASPIKEEQGHIKMWVGSTIDIHEHKILSEKIELSEKKFRLLTNAMPQKITNADADGNVIFFNQQWIDDTGLTFDELVADGWEKAMHPDDLESTTNNWKHSVATGDIFDRECRIQNKKGDYRWHLSRAVPIEDETGKIIMWVGSNTDIHDLKEAKNKAETATQRAESAVKAKQQFLSNMSHEIRTPMNAIIGFTNVVLKTDLSEKQKEYINAIKLSGDALIVLINDILDIAKVDAGKMTFEQIPFDLCASIAATLHLFEPKIQEKNLELIENCDAAIPKILLGDSLRLRQIILNLLSNAVKFTDEGKITVSIRMLKEEADHVTIEFSVTDTGIGIPENKIEPIFDDFQQATDETSRLHGGTGLGLSIVKQLVTLQGGTIIVNSQSGKGSTFGFILNFKKAISEMAAITATNNGAEFAETIENIRVLVAEDMPLNQLLIKIILEDFGYVVDIAGNGKIAIEKLQENKYDIILMDLQMPELNGFETTEYIRSKMNSQIPIIALTADVTTVDVEKCEAVGMNDYISKPIDEKLLYGKIIKCLKKANGADLPL